MPMLPWYLEDFLSSFQNSIVLCRPGWSYTHRNPQSHECQDYTCLTAPNEALFLSLFWLLFITSPNFCCLKGYDVSPRPDVFPGYRHLTGDTFQHHSFKYSTLTFLFILYFCLQFPMLAISPDSNNITFYMGQLIW